MSTGSKIPQLVKKALIKKPQLVKKALIKEPSSVIPFAIGGLLVLLLLLLLFYFVFFNKSKSSPEPDAGEPPSTGSIDDVIDNQINEISKDVENSVKEGYISQREYMSPDPSKSIVDFTEIVLKYVVGKPIKAVVSRDDVSGVLKVAMTGVDPKVFEPSVSKISECVSDKLKTAKTGVEDNVPMYVFKCTDEYFSTNGKEFQDTIAPAALTMYENAFNKYASESEKKRIEESGGFKKMAACKFVNTGGQRNECMKGTETPKITWDKVKKYVRTRENPTYEKQIETPTGSHQGE